MYEDQTNATVIADSIYDGVRLVTFRATFPRFILAEFNTHRAFSRNSASSRAIPLKKQIELVEAAPFKPSKWPINGPGMNPAGFYGEPFHSMFDAQWETARQAMLGIAKAYEHGRVHKSIAARYLEPFMWHTVIVSSTMPGLDNFFLQRDHEDAQPEMQTLARAMRKALDESEPEEREIHVPFEGDIIAAYRRAHGVGPMDEKIVIQSVARLARVSYGRELEEKTYEEDVNLVVRLLKAGHASPFEHVGIVMPETSLPYKQVAAALRRADHLGNFEYPWSQLRHHVKDYLPTIAAKLDSEHST